jgi:hypothetical protein
MSVGLKLAIMKKALISQPGNKFQAFPYVKSLFVTLFLFALLSLHGGEVWGQTSSTKPGNWFGADNIWGGTPPANNATVYLKNRAILNAPPTNINIPKQGQISGNILYITTGVYTFGATAPDPDLTPPSEISPVYLGQVTSTFGSPTIVGNGAFEYPELTLSPEGSIIQTPSGNQRKYKEPDKYFNGNLGIISSINTTEIDDIPTTTVTLDKSANYAVSNSSYSGSTLLDPMGGTYQKLVMYQNNKNEAQSILHLKSGITNFEGGATLYNGNIKVENDATLILGPLKCRVCDPEDNSYDPDICQSEAYNDCRELRLEMFFGTAVSVAERGRIIVYGNVDNQAQPGLFAIEGGLYIVGNFFSRGTAVTDGSGDIYTTGSMITQGNASIFGQKNIDCPGDCQATQVLCGWTITTTPSGIVPFCNDIVLNGNIVDNDAGTNPDTQGKDFQWQWYNPALNEDQQIIGWQNIGPVGNEEIPPIGKEVDCTGNCVIKDPGPGGQDFYRLMATTGVSGCTSYSPTVAVVGSDFEIWKGVNTSWANISNWCLTIPNETISVVIPPTSNNPAINSSASVLNMFILEGAMVENLSGSTLNIYGDLAVSGSSVAARGELINNGNINFKGVNSSINSFGKISGTTGTIRFEENMQLITGFSQEGTDWQFHHIILGADKILSLFNGQDAEIKVSGDITLHGELESQASKIVLNGSDDQTITNLASGNNFSDIEINKLVGSVSLNGSGGNLNLEGELKIASATALNANGKLVLKSYGAFEAGQNASTFLDASVAALPSGASIIGSVRVERYMHKIGKKTFRYISSPVASATAPAILAERYVYVYTNGVGSWVRRAATSTLNKGIGYAANVSDANAGSAWSVFGTVNQHSHSWNFSNEGWHLIGNPYPSAISWSAVGWTATNISKLIVITDNSIDGTDYYRYFSYDGTVDLAPISGDWTYGGAENKIQEGIVAMGQAFWVYSGAGGGTLIINESAKAGTEKEGNFYRKDNINNSLQLGISISNGNSADKTVLNLDASNEENQFAKIKKLWNPELNIYFIDEAKGELLINTVDEFSIHSDLPIGFEANAAGDYTMQFGLTDTYSLLNELYLIDAYEGTATNVLEVQSYNFKVYDSSKPVNDRFYLSMHAAPKLTEEVKLYVFPNPVMDVLKIRTHGADQIALSTLRNINGKVIDTANWIGEYDIQMSNYPAGMYILQVKTDNGLVTSKIIKQ